MSRIASCWIYILCIMLAAVCAQFACASVLRAADWEAEFKKWEAAEEQTPPPVDPVLFVGSSSIRLWKLAESFPNLPVVNHGFGGSQAADTLANLDRIVLRYKPRVVVFYAGDNDIASGKSPGQVANDVTAVAEKLHAALPETRLVYISIKPSIARWHLIDNVRAANCQIAAKLKDDPHARFVSVEAEMLGEDGRPRKELFVDDGLHLNATGYGIWTKLLLPEIDMSTK